MSCLTLSESAISRTTGRIMLTVAELEAIWDTAEVTEHTGKTQEWVGDHSKRTLSRDFRPPLSTVKLIWSTDSLGLGFFLFVANANEILQTFGILKIADLLLSEASRTPTIRVYISRTALGQTFSGIDRTEFKKVIFIKYSTQFLKS